MTASEDLLAQASASDNNEETGTGLTVGPPEQQDLEVETIDAQSKVDSLMASNLRADTGSSENFNAKTYNG